MEKTRFMGFKSYKDYLNSFYWKDKKYWVFQNCKNINNQIQCEKCNELFKNFKLCTLHHLNYNCIGSERKEDLMIVCNNCHEKIHKDIKFKTTKTI